MLSRRAISALPETAAIALAPHRINAMVLRYLYLLRSSWSRLLELIYWPAMQLFVWGFLQFYVAQNSGFFARASGVFIGAVLMWDILFRGQLGFSVSFLEEMWSRNLSNILISPLRPIQSVRARTRAGRFLCEPDPDQLGGRNCRGWRASA
jgi:ABC-2 type transport system permease protein